MALSSPMGPPAVEKHIRTIHNQHGWDKRRVRNYTKAYERSLYLGAQITLKL